MKTRTDILKLRQAQLNAQRQVLIRMPNNVKAKEPLNEKAKPMQADTQNDKRDAIRADFAIPPVVHTPDAKRRAAQLSQVEMEAIRTEALTYTRPYDAGERKEL